MSWSWSKTPGLGLRSRGTRRGTVATGRRAVAWWSTALHNTIRSTRRALPPVELLGWDIRRRVGDGASLLRSGSELVHGTLRRVDKLVHGVLVLLVEPLQLLHVAVAVFDERKNLLDTVSRDK